MKNIVINAFTQNFGQNPACIVRAPGRVNLIGEHTDYNDGFVFPMAINRAVWIALRPRQDRQVIVHSLDFSETVKIDLEDFVRGASDWSEYIKGIAWALQGSGAQLSGWEGVLAGNIPIGSGLSSSAAIEIAVARAFSLVSKFTWKPASIAKMAQRAENEWVGVKCGIMDQLISALAVAGNAALIDCRSLRIEQVPLPNDITVVVMNTMKQRGLVDSAYNERRSQCEAAAKYFGVPALRDVGIDELMAARDKLEGVIFKRAHHVITENARALQMAKLLRQRDSQAAGKLMYQSHTSLRDDFEVSCVELDQMVEAATAHPGCLGARMTGAGFGGCAVALVMDDAVEEFSKQVSEDYLRVTNIEPEMLISDPAQGANAEKLN